MHVYQSVLRPLLFCLDPERAHGLALRAGQFAISTGTGRAALNALYGYEHPALCTRVAGMAFANPVGLPAGFDKNGLALQALAAIGFGLLDIGSVSLLPSTGNAERPRLFRLPDDDGIMVFYGVPNDGVESVAQRLDGLRLPVPLGLSLVETNTGVPASVDSVIAELVAAARVARKVSDYRVLNLNCPNSGGGFSHFDDPAHLRALLQAMQDVEREGRVFLRMSPPRDPALIDALLEAIDPFPFVKGIGFYTFPADLATRLKTPLAVRAQMRGSFSGPANRASTEEAIRQWYSRIDRSRLALIGVGGIFTAEDAYRSIRLGASLVQIYTALIYRGPGVVGEIKRGLVRLLAHDGFASVAEAVGVDHPQGRREY
jgi:dihydroorotate dehydrogenase (fumarate)/dihydroorotate dehydrogenase